MIYPSLYLNMVSNWIRNKIFIYNTFIELSTSLKMKDWHRKFNSKIPCHYLLEKSLSSSFKIQNNWKLYREDLSPSGIIGQHIQLLQLTSSFLRLIHRERNFNWGFHWNIRYYWVVRRLQLFLSDIFKTVLPRLRVTRKISSSISTFFTIAFHEFLTSWFILEMVCYIFLVQ